jgi:hypothetical protein
MHSRYATWSELWTWAAVIEAMRCRTRVALGERPVLPQTRSSPLDSLAQTVDVRPMSASVTSYTAHISEVICMVSGRSSLVLD